MNVQMSIYSDNLGHRIIFNGVTIGFKNDELIAGVGSPTPHIRIERGHPDGPVLCYYGLKVVISPEDEKKLNNIGVQII